MPFHKPTKHSLIDSRDCIGKSLGKFYLVYEDSPIETFYGKWLKKGFQHVTAYKFTGFFWLKMDFSLGYSDFDVLCYDWHDSIKDVLSGQTYQYVEVWREPRYRVRSIVAPWTCVEAMKSLLGIREPFILTPWQLYKHVEAL